MRLPTFKTPCFHFSFIPTAETLAHLVRRGARWANTCCFVSAGAFECMKAERGSARERNKVNNNQINPQFLCQHLSFTALPLPPPHLPSTPERNKWMNNYRYKHLRAIQRVFFSPPPDILLNITASSNSLLNSFSSGAFTAHYFKASRAMRRLLWSFVF